MITCKICKKYAKLKSVIINGLGQVKLIGSCKHCGYNHRPRKYKNGREVPRALTDAQHSNFPRVPICKEKQRSSKKRQ